MNMKQMLMEAFQKVWRNWLRENESVRKEMSDEPKGNSTLQVQRFLEKHFDFRYNTLTGVTEFRPRGAKEQTFLPVDERQLNGMIVDAHMKGIYCWNSAISTLVLSNKVEAYHPFRSYMDELPAWDGVDRVTPLLQRVSTNELWLGGARCWLRAMVSHWMGEEHSHANSLMPILISRNQGLGKSTFCRMLMPDSLRTYYLDNLNLSPGASPEKRLINKGLINLDEFDKIGEKRQPDLKNLLQMLSVPVYRGKRLGYVTEPRLASFIATTNNPHILTDRSGSRRFLCVEVKQFISSEPLQHKLLYAQLKHELEAGLPTYLNKYEEAAWQRHNRKFYQESLLEDVFHSCFRLPENVAEGEWLTSAHIFKVMVKHNSTALRGISAKRLSYHLRGMGLESKHTQYGNVYRVVFRESSL
jgi:predicted P-loop ATPase